MNAQNEINKILFDTIKIGNETFEEINVGIKIGEVDETSLPILNKMLKGIEITDDETRQFLSDECPDNLIETISTQDDNEMYYWFKHYLKIQDSIWCIEALVKEAYEYGSSFICFLQPYEVVEQITTTTVYVRDTKSIVEREIKKGNKEL